MPDPEYPQDPGRWKNLAKVDPVLQRASMATGFPKEYLQAIAMVESHGGRNLPARTPGGAEGMFQQIPTKVEPQWSQNNMIPDSSAVHAAEMLQWILAHKGHGDTTATIAKYNAGPYSGVESSDYSDQVKDVVKQIRTRNAAKKYAPPTESPYSRPPMASVLYASNAAYTDPNEYNPMRITSPMRQSTTAAK